MIIIVSWTPPPRPVLFSLCPFLLIHVALSPPPSPPLPYPSTSPSFTLLCSMSLYLFPPSPPASPPLPSPSSPLHSPLLPSYPPQQLEKLELFEELDRRLMERVGVHLQDVGDLSSPALAKILRDTDNSPGPFQQYLAAPSPAASASATPSPAARTSDSSEQNTSGSFSGASEGSSLVGINLANVASPAKSLTSILSGGPLEGVSGPTIDNGTDESEAASKERASAAGRGRAAAAAAGGGNSTHHAAPVDLQAYFSGSGRELDEEESAAGSPSGSFAGERRTRGGISSSSRGRGSVGGGGGGRRDKHYQGTLPVHDNGTSRGDRNDNSSSVGVSEGRGWAPSPINAVQKDDGVAPWGAGTTAGGNGSGSDGYSGRGVAGGGEDVAGPGGNYTVYDSEYPGGFDTAGGRSANPSRRREDDPCFDEARFKDHENRLRHAFMQRMGSVDSASTVGPGMGGESLSPLSKWGPGSPNNPPSVNRRCVL